MIQEEYLGVHRVAVDVSVGVATSTRVMEKRIVGSVPSGKSGSSVKEEMGVGMVPSGRGASVAMSDVGVGVGVAVASGVHLAVGVELNVIQDEYGVIGIEEETSQRVSEVIWTGVVPSGKGGSVNTSEVRDVSVEMLLVHDTIVVLLGIDVRVSVEKLDGVHEPSHVHDASRS